MPTDNLYFTTKILILVLIFPLIGHVPDWQPADNPLMTRWANGINPVEPLPEYPRQQMKRAQWKNINGLWKYVIIPVLNDKPQKWDRNILVPFGIESALSGVKKRVGPDNKLWYRKTFTVPGEWEGKQVMLNFGAVDWRSDVWVNGKKVGDNDGGYTSFSLNITNALKDSGEQQITVSVWDPKRSA